MPNSIREKYKRFVWKDPQTGTLFDDFRPHIPVLLVGNHQVGRSIYALVDSGSDISVFPAKYAEIYFKMSRKKIEKGKKVKIKGIGGSQIIGFKHNITLHALKFRLKTQVYFSYNQEVPILGRKGFFDKFKSVNFYENDKIIELVSKC
jgi:hypothetical protein